MNSLVALPIAAAIPTAAPAMDFPLAPVSVPPLPAADRELVELAKQLVEAVAESRRLNLIVDAMDGDRWVAPPASLTVTAEDKELGIPEPTDYRGDRIDSYTVDVSRLRAEKWAVASKTDHADGGCTVTVRQFTPSPEARSRADEIVAAYYQWTAAKEKRPKGFRAAKRAYDQAEKIESHLEQRIHAIQATTLEGMTAKAHCCELYCFEEGVHGSFSESIAKDLLALNATTSMGAPADATRAGPASSPAVEAVARWRKASKRFDRAYDKLDAARNAAEEQHGREPLALIRWRNYSHIGGGEIDGARRTFLAAGEDLATIELEYRDAKKRYRAIVKAAKDWERRAGVDGLSRKVDEARAELKAAQEALGTVELRSVGDASALLEWLRPNVKHGDIQPWELAALGNASKFLRLSSAVA